MSSAFRRRWDFWTIGIARPLRAILVAVLLLILPAIGIIRDVVLQPEDRNWGLLKYMPKIGWYWYALAILLGLLLLLEETSFRAHRAGLKAQRAKHIKRFATYKERHPTQPPVVIIQGTPDPPNLISSTQIRRVYRDAEGVIFERDAGEEVDTDFWAVTADFNNAILPKRKPGEVAEVSGRINFSPFETSNYVTLDRGAWLRQRSGKVMFGRNDTRELVVATLENDRMYAIKQLAVIDGQRVTTRVELPDAPYSVAIRLNAEVENKAIKRTPLICERTGEIGIRLTMAFRWRYERLGDFKEKGYELFDKSITLAKSHLENPTPSDADVETAISVEFLVWQETVAEFLAKRWDDAHKQRFLPDPPKPRPDAPAWSRRRLLPPLHPPPELHSKILAKTKILDDFQNELMQASLKELAI